MQRAVELIPAAWQYPENACARILLDGQEYQSKHFKTTSWHQNTPIILNGNHVGDVDVYYIQKPPVRDGGPFLEEEDRLLRAIGERLSKVLWLKRSEAALKESESRYRVLTEQVTEGVSLVQDHCFCYVNPAFCRLFNVSSARKMHDAAVHHPPGDDAGDISRLFRSVGDGTLEAKVEEVHQLTRSEKTFWIQVCHSPITFKGRPALLSTFKDISEIKEQQMAAQRMADLLDSENRVLRSSLKERYRLGEILGRSPAMQEVYEFILKAAATDASVAIFGESGSGKELVAHAIHDHSDRKKERFVAVNCGAIQETLFEREFFGHCKGSFSGAHADLPGYNDFFYRIQVIQIQLPPLRHRKQDLALLVEHFLRKMKKSSGPISIPGRIMDTMIEYDWPGNVRELRNVLQRYVALGHLDFLSPDPKFAMAPIPAELNLPDAIQQLEKALISKALHQAGGNRTQAASLLGISRRTLFRKMSSC